MSLNLILDIGNSLSKLALFNKENIIFLKQYESISLKILENVFKNHHHIRQGIVSNVRQEDDKIYSFLKQNLTKLLILDEKTPLPVENLYKTKSTLGKDRIAAAVGGYSLFPGVNVLIIDAGTALTYEFVTSGGQYIGGGISPGLKMRFRSLHENTKKLPLTEPKEKFQLPANTTKSAIISGVQSGIIYEIDGIINEFREQFNSLRIVLTGGDSIFFEKKLKNSIFVDSNIVLKGLNQILIFNA